MSRVIAPSRLHFGLFRLPAERLPERADYWLDLDGNPTVPARDFGGVGLMIDKPGVHVRAERAASWSAQGPLADRALRFGQRFVSSLALAHNPTFHIDVVECAPEHVGLGTGTQLGLAVARALALELRLPDLSAVELAQRTGRGERSGLGIHGFEQGGFLVDGGKSKATVVAPRIACVPFPDDWHIVLVLPENLQGTHGEHEREAFAQLSHTDLASRQTDALCRLVLLGMLPALIEKDLPAFGEALYDFNRRVGEMFRPWQGGIYADDHVASLVQVFRDLKVHAVGQSSWGPVTFAIVPGAGAATDISAWVCRTQGLAPERVLVTSASKSGALVTQT